MHTSGFPASGSRRILAAIVGLWIVLIGGIALVGHGALREIERESVDIATANAARVARLLLANFERTADAIDGFMTNFASDVTPPATRDALQERLEELYLPLAIVQVTLVGPDGRVFVNSLQPDAEAIDLSDREHIRVHLEDRVDGLYVSAPVFGRISQQWTIQFTRALRDADGALRAIIVASYDLADFVAFYEALDFDRQGVVALAGLDGIMRVRSGVESSYGQDLSQEIHEIGVTETEGGQYRVSPVDGVERIGYAVRSERYPFYTYALFDRSYVDARAASVRTPIVVSLSLLALVVTFATIGALWTIRRETIAAARLLQKRRLEALGQLTGGIAHDFNNLLTIIMGNLDLLRRAEESRRERHIRNALMAAERGKSLTQQLLAFGRRQTLSPAVHDLNRIIRDMEEMLTHSLRGDIAVTFDLADGLWPVEIDAEQLQIALINLAVNSRDAMPDGGRLRFETANDARSDRVTLTVGDTGAGMTREIAARAVEPFFTTKAIGSGTGLGLAQVHGFVQQSGGELSLRSEPGKGTTITLAFPRAAAELTVITSETAASEHPPGFAPGMKAIVVDDNPEIAALAVSVLMETGFEVREFRSGDDALPAVNEGGYDLLLTDIVMPGRTDGLALARAAKAATPGVAVVVMTGYSSKLESGEQVDGELLLKPFTPSDLADAIRRTLPDRVTHAKSG